jgi:UDP-N-acetylmuramoyl-tripeptide--D-alanyl-D-alanine ligase
MRFSARDLAEALNDQSPARLIGPDSFVDGVGFDSREVRSGQLFVPIVAERDGHEFVADAVGRGAVAYLSSRGPIPGVEAACIEVVDTSAALIDAARWARTRFPAGTMAVGITGSVGKTSTKDFVAAALAAERRVTASQKSFNNEQGLPVTILNAPIDAEVLVLEMGMRGFGQIDFLCRIARPAIGVVTRVGEAHTSLVGGIEGVARAKGELVEALPSFGVAVLNADDPRVLAMRSRTSARVLTYGESIDAEVYIENLRLDERGRSRFTIRSPHGRADVSLDLPGRHMASNAAAAIAVGDALGVSLESMVAGLTTAKVAAHRMAEVITSRGALVLDDSYNANPTSMEAALRTLAALPTKRKTALLGLMAELEEPDTAHRKIAELADRLGIVVVGVATDLYATRSTSLDEAVAIVQSMDSDDAVLVKGSRVAGLERVVESVSPR